MKNHFTIALLLLIPVALCTEIVIPNECQPKLLRHYDELGCHPEFDNGSCPVRYNCSSLEGRDPNKCYVNGSVYNIGESIGNFDEICKPACVCAENEGKAHITCAIMDCVEFFRPPDSNCKLQYNLDSCCSISRFCATEPGQTTDVTCQYNGRTLIENERFYPEGSCMQCICKEGFNGTLTSPWCKSVKCGIELNDYFSTDCAPIYFGTDRCCPIQWRCPEESDHVITTPESANTRSSEDVCKFGSLRLHVHEKLSNSTTEDCLECACKTPPMVTCIKSRYQC